MAPVKAFAPVRQPTCSLAASAIVGVLLVGIAAGSFSVLILIAGQP